MVVRPDPTPLTPYVRRRRDPVVAEQVTVLCITPGGKVQVHETGTRTVRNYTVGQFHKFYQPKESSAPENEDSTRSAIHPAEPQRQTRYV